MVQDETRIYGGADPKKSAFQNFITGHIPQSKYVTLPVLILTAMLTGPSFFNFPPLYDLLIHNQTYVWKCKHPGEPGYSPYSAFDENGSCVLQQGGVGRLFTIICTVQFIFSAISGQAADMFSPKLLGITGLIISLLGWLTLFLSTKAFPLYMVGAILLGIGQDMSFFPMVQIKCLFKKEVNAVIAMLGTGRSLSVLNILFVGTFVRYENAAKLAALYYTCGFVFAMFIQWTCVPWKIPKDDEEEMCELDKEGGEASAPKKASVIKVFTHPYFYLYVFYAVTALLRPTLVGAMSARVLKTQSQKNFFQIATALSFSPCPVLGAMVDKFGISIVGQIVNMTGLVSVLSILGDELTSYKYSNLMMYILSISHAINCSFILSQLYCYGQTTFKSDHYFRMVGILVAIGGTSTLSADPIFQYCIRAKSFKLGCYVMIVLSIIAAILFYIIESAKAKKLKSGEETPESIKI